MQHIKFSDIKINDGFWKIKQDMVRESTVSAVYDRFRDTHRFDALSCTWKPGDPNRRISFGIPMLQNGWRASLTCCLKNAMKSWR